MTSGSADCAEERGFKALPWPGEGTISLSRKTFGWVRYEVKIPTLSRQKAVGQGGGTRNHLKSEISLRCGIGTWADCFPYHSCVVMVSFVSLIHRDNGECYAIGR